MYKLDYTKEMQEQDKLWETESEDLNTMLEQRRDIVRQARLLGFKNKVEIYKCNGEIVSGIYFEDDEDTLMSGFNKSFIDNIESILNYKGEKSELRESAENFNSMANKLNKMTFGEKEESKLDYFIGLVYESDFDNLKSEGKVELYIEDEKSYAITQYILIKNVILKQKHYGYDTESERHFCLVVLEGIDVTEIYV